jgi:hypothetical protein
MRGSWPPWGIAANENLVGVGAFCVRVVEHVVGMMRSFQRMSEALINHLDRDEGRASMPNEGSQRAPAGSSSIHRELEKVKFPEFWGATDGLSHRGMVGEHGDVLHTS